MKEITLHNTDLKLTNLCLGSSPFGNRMAEEDSFLVLDRFVEAGGTFIDTANAYCRWVPGLTNCSEQVLAKWLKSRNAYNKVVIASKAAHYECSNGLDGKGRNRLNRTEVHQDLEESLSTLGLDHFDLYWLHRDNYEMSMGEIIDIMEELVKSGKIRYYGLSNYTMPRLKEGMAYAKEHGLQGFHAVSNQWSLALTNDDVRYNPDPTIVMCMQEEYHWHVETEMPIVPYTSTSRGFYNKLAQLDVPVKDGKLLVPAEELPIADNVKYPYLNEGNLRIYELLKELSAETGHSLQTLALAWLLNQSFQVFPIFSVSKLSQMDDVLAASEILLSKEWVDALSVHYK